MERELCNSICLAAMSVAFFSELRKAASASSEQGKNRDFYKKLKKLSFFSCF
jgi:hypothetical protein